ncbi:MAG: TRZ/ATZ family hydrolase [Hahellaceae bacterium]|nr:TRZ/ATZ family hydrolase [Hahellaceae bacterium]
MTSMMTVDTAIYARWIVPIRPANICLENHCILIRERKIVAIVPQDEASQQYRANQVIELNTHVLMPGLINAHGHSAMTLFRGLADDLPLMEWLSDHIWPAEGQWVSEEFVQDGTLLAIAEMIRSGTTCFSDMYFFPEITAKVALEHGIRTQICFPVMDFPTAWGSGPDEYIHKGLQLIDQYRHNDFVSVAFGPHAPYTVSDEPLQKIVTLAEQLDVPVQIHLHETAFEVFDAEDKSGIRPIQRLADLGLLSPRLQCVHMTQISDEDLALLTSSRASVIHCPESNLKLASGFCPVDRLLDAGVNVALGTDGAASNNDLDLLGELRTAALLGKAVANNAAAINAFTALEMATINGAKALGLDEKIGSLEIGKFADIIAIDFSEIESAPLYDPISHLVYATSSRQVTHSWIGGDLRMNNRQLTMIDSQGLREKADQWASNISNHNMKK